MENFYSFCGFAAQSLIGFYFIFFGVWNIYHWTPISEILLKRKLPSPLFLLSIVIGLQMLTGFMIFFGVLRELAALLLLPFTIFIVFILHPFWNFEGQLRKLHMAFFVTNLTMNMAALLLLIKVTHC